MVERLDDEAFTFNNHSISRSALAVIGGAQICGSASGPRGRDLLRLLWRGNPTVVEARPSFFGLYLKTVVREWAAPCRRQSVLSLSKDACFDKLSTLVAGDSYKKETRIDFPAPADREWS